MGGQIIPVCRVAGYEMPPFIFWASCLILCLFIYASLMMLKQCRDVANTLSTLAREMERLPKRPSLAQTELNAIREVMLKQSITAGHWRQFEDTLLVSPTSREIYATSSPEQILSKPALIEDHVSTSLFAAIPGVLTGVGLLMTFVAILDGLSHVSVSQSMDVQGIGGLINGLSGKFISSIVAVTCAVLFVFIERIAYAGPHEAYRKLLAQIGARFRRRTTEHLLQSIETYLHMQSQTLADLRGGKLGRPQDQPQGE
jgi:hypothetical protein